MDGLAGQQVGLRRGQKQRRLGDILRRGQTPQQGRIAGRFHALLREDPEPTEAEIREALAGNICRCTGYGRIVDAVRRAAGVR